ncbi:MAG: hypothetical protein ABR524_13440 [Thermoanaerobaculia bacterium]
MRRFTVLILFFVLIGIAGSVAVAVAVYHRVRDLGTIEVSIEDSHNRVRLALPAALATAVLDGGRLHLDGVAVELRHDLRDWAPAIEAALEGMEGYPDVPLVQIVDGRDRVTIRKLGTKILVEIDSGSERVKVTVPEESLRRALRKAGARG